MNFTEQDLARLGLIIQDGRAVKRSKGVMPSDECANMSAVRPAENRRSGSSVRHGDSADGGVTHPPDNTSKYRNQSCYVGSDRFDSKREAEFWMALQLRVHAREISDLRRQVPFDLCCPTPGPTMVVAQYVADFTWRDRDDRLHVADAKGVRTQLYRLKAKWMNLQYGIVIEEL